MKLNINLSMGFNSSEIIHDQLKSTTPASNLELDLELRLGRHTAAPK